MNPATAFLLMSASNSASTTVRFGHLCPTCKKDKFYPQADGKRKCRNCGTTYP